MVGMLNAKKVTYLLVNFGGPREQGEVEEFLISLLTDQDVVRTNFPPFIHNPLFTFIAKKRAVKISKDYQEIGGKSPIYSDTETLANELRGKLHGTLLTFHRYLPATHRNFITQLTTLDCDEIRVFPLFPQFTYATTGSIARWFARRLPPAIVKKMRWIKSYPSHPSFVNCQINLIKDFLSLNELEEKETVLLFSAHGVPKRFIKDGDLYQDECEASFKAVMKGFPEALGRICYQSKFGKGEWLRPYTLEACEDIVNWHQKRSHIVFVPISFTSDHIETLFEVEQEYMPPIRTRGLNAYRVPALTLRPDWVEAILKILEDAHFCSNPMLIRPKTPFLDNICIKI